MRKYSRFMSTINLKAHFDGERIQLDEPFDLLPNAPLVVTVLSTEQDGDVAARDLAIINANSEQLNKEAWDVLDYQGLP